jgi:hypothetical protein
MAAEKNVQQSGPKVQRTGKNGHFCVDRTGKTSPPLSEHRPGTINFFSQFTGSSVLLFLKQGPERHLLKPAKLITGFTDRYDLTSSHTIEFFDLVA